VALYREQAAVNLAYLPDLAGTLDNLGQYRLDAGLALNADAAWSAAGRHVHLGSEGRGCYWKSSPRNPAP
jgi:hypothetical protein